MNVVFHFLNWFLLWGGECFECFCVFYWIGYFSLCNFNENITYLNDFMYFRAMYLRDIIFIKINEMEINNTN